MKIAVFWCVMSCHLVQKYPHIGGTYYHCLQCRPWRWRQQVPPKRQYWYSSTIHDIRDFLLYSIFLWVHKHFTSCMTACCGPQEDCITQYVNASVRKSNEYLGISDNSKQNLERVVCVYLLQDHRSQYCYGHCHSSFDHHI
jgi:hypothetical protein